MAYISWHTSHAEKKNVLHSVSERWGKTKKQDGGPRTSGQKLQIKTRNSITVEKDFSLLSWCWSCGDVQRKTNGSNGRT